MTQTITLDTDNAQASSGNEGIVYVLTNPAMPGLVKIGRTGREEVTSRINELSRQSGVPLPFECAYAVMVENALQTEKALHSAFAPQRLNPKEFFEIRAEQVRPVLDLLKLEDVTPSVDEEVTEGIDPANKAASEKFIKSRRPDLDFGDLDIPVGAVLEFTRDSKETATVVDTNTKTKTRVNYQGSEYPISGITATLLGWKASYVPNSGRFWNYEGRLLQDIYNETHGF